MSYILDALKKSEQERGRGNTPGVQTVHSSSINYHNEKKHYWPYILITAVLLNLAAVLYFIFDKNTATDTPYESKVTEQNIVTDKNQKNAPPLQVDIPAKKILAITETPESADNKISVTDRPTMARTQARQPEPDKTKTDPVASRAQEKELNIISYHDLQDSIKTQLPAIIISAHVYSSNPAQRSIVINNNFLEEGEYIIDDLVLHEVTPEGAILNYQGILFSYGAVSSWQ